MDYTKKKTCFTSFGEIFQRKQYPINLVTMSGFSIRVPALWGEKAVADHRVRIRAALTTHKTLRLADPSELKK